ncbi:MAG: hypothetical protein AAGJ68_05420 [Pseudomonadota bacterium]
MSTDIEAGRHVRERLQSRLSMGMNRPIKFELTKPTAEVLSVPNNKHHKAISKGNLEITISFDSKDDSLCISETMDTIEIVISTSKANELLEGLEGLFKGENDYAMWGVDDDGVKSCIWFW